MSDTVNDITCEKCNRVFKYPRDLARHKQRKTPCAFIVERTELCPIDQQKSFECRYCGRKFASRPSLNRHMRQSCKIANSDEGMEKLMDYTIQRQMAQLVAQNEALQVQVTELTGIVKKNDNLQSQVAELTGLVKKKITVQQNIGVQQNNVQFNIVSFNSDDRIRIPVSAVIGAFTENPLLKEYCRMTDKERTDADLAAPYVLEALVDLVRRAHRDPVYRNVYLSPNRADQVMVCVNELEGDSAKTQPGNWEVRALTEAIRFLFDGVANGVQRIIVSNQDRTQLPFEVQSAASWIPNLYKDEPERFIRDGRAPMAAHLANTRPSWCK